jgi:serine protease Do
MGGYLLRLEFRELEEAMSTRRSTLFYGLLVALASIMVGMVIASRLDLSPESIAQTLATPPANSAPLSGPVDATTFRTIAKTVSPAVVNIRTESRQRAQDLREFFGGGGGGNPFEFFGPPSSPGGDDPPEDILESAGTGFIIDKSGLILTNNHVVEGTSKIRVVLFHENDDDDRTYDAKIVGRDPLTDSALLQLTEKADKPLPEIKFGDSSQMQPGDWVMAIGNPFNLAHTVSVGVVSGIGRPLQVMDSRRLDFIQTDAAINPGNSGGPLLNVRGEVVGINTAIFSDARQQGNIGIGFAVPINLVRDLLPQLRAGKVTRGRIGVLVKDVGREEFDEFGLKNRDGAVISSVLPSGAAAKAGIEAGDVLTTFGGKPIRRSDDLVQMVTSSKPGSAVPARLVRGGSERSVTLTIDELDLESEGNRPRAQGRESAPAPETSKGFGLELGPITAEYDRELKLNGRKGALVYGVDRGSPAWRGGLRQGDVIVRIGKRTVATTGDAADELGKVQTGGTALVWVIREGRETFLTMTKE